MKLVFLFVLLSGLAGQSFAQTVLCVTVNNISSTSGVVQLALYDNEKDFLKVPVKTLTVRIDGASAVGNFDDVLPGQYAVSCFHDLNSNKKLDTNWLGIPTEPYGFSNNARGVFGPPSFKEAGVDVKEGNNQIELKLK